MIRRISRRLLNIDKYTACLNKAVNYRIYGEYWYLDVLTNQHWDCFVYNDYEAVMPIPYQKKFAIKMISQPIFCQQLGIFHSENLPKQVLFQFHKMFKSNLIRGYHFNEENQEILKLSNVKINQILPLNFDYSDFIKSIRKNRKHELMKGLPSDYRIENSNIDSSFIALLKKNYSTVLDDLTLNNLTQLVQEIQQRELGLTINVYYKDEVVASSFYIRSKNRLIQLSNAKKEYSTINFNTFIVDDVVKSHLNQQFILDFEGSSIKGIKEFNSSFRAKTTYFGVYQSKLIKPLKFF